MVEARLARLLGVPVTRVRHLGTGHAWTLHRVELGGTARGGEVFVKAAPGAAPALAAEVAGLRWLRSAGGEGSTIVPPVLAAEEGMLVLPWLPATAPTSEAAEEFGRSLARLHRVGADCFGAPWEGWIATLPLDNTPTGGGWGGWYAQRRLLPYLRMAVDRGLLTSVDQALLEQVAERIDELAGPEEPPSRIHGDLWSGNLVWTQEGVVVIDPAAHGGHRETDLAMLALFGAPFLDTITAAYRAVAPLADGFRARIPLHQIHPLLVHVVLFGGRYRASLLRAAHDALHLAAR